MNSILRALRLQLSILIAGALILTTSSATVFAYVQPIWLEVNQSYFYAASKNSTITRVAVANPKIADVNVIDNHNINIVAYAPGSTSLTVWTKDGMRQDFTINVSKVDTNEAYIIKQAIKIPGITVEKVEDRILLRGLVKNQNEKMQAQGVAELFAGSKDKVINLLELKNPTQVNLAAMVIDISNSDARDLGLMYGSNQHIYNGSSDSSSNTITFSSGNFYGGMTYHDNIGKWYNSINFKLNALISEGKVRVLSRPNITTLSGQEAEILIGGEIPIPTSNNGDVSVTWREYGIKLHIKPEVDSNNQITSAVQAEISNIDHANAVTTTAGTIPALTSRKAQTTITLADGNTMAIGGLMNNQESKIVSGIPLLSKIPILGEFFKTTSTSKDKRELVILITPAIVTVDDPVKASDRLKKAVTEAQNSYANMQELYPNQIPEQNKQTATSQPSKAQVDKASDEALNLPNVPAPVPGSQQTKKY